MFSTVLKEITGYLDGKFILSIFFPSLIFWGLAVCLVVITHTPTQFIATWSKQPVEISVFLIVLFLTWVTFCAYLLANSLTTLTRLYEGYWERIPGHRYFARSRRKYYQEQLAYLSDTLKVLREQRDRLKKELETTQSEIELKTRQDNQLNNELATLQSEVEQLQRIEAERQSIATELKRTQASLEDIKEQLQQAEVERKRVYEEIYLYFPAQNRLNAVLPTSLGNILKSAELYPLLRYHIDAVLIWPRLYTLLPEVFAKTLSNAKSSLDLMLILSFLGFCFAFLSGIYLLVVGASWGIFLLCFWGGIAVGWLSYQSAVEAAMAYSQLIKTAFDLYRGSVIKALGLQLPSSLKEELIMWDNINLYLYRNLLEQPEAFKYAKPEESPETTVATNISFGLDTFKYAKSEESQESSQ